MPKRPIGASRRFMKLAAAITAIATVGVLSGCASSDNAGASDGGLPSGELQILVSSADASDAAFKAINEAFEQKYPDVKVTFSSVSNDNYPATKSSRLTAANVDIFVVKNLVEVPDYAKDSASDYTLFAQSGGLVDLTDESFMSRFTPTVLDAQAIGGRHYAIPTGLSYSTGVYYNKSIFAKYGLSVPTTWTELQSVLSTLTAQNVTPFGIGGKDLWPAGLPMLASVASLYPTLESKQELAKSLWENSASLDSGLPLTVLQKTQTILQNTQKNFSGAGYDDIPAAFARGDFAMMPDGTWNAPTISTAVDGAFDIGFFPLPVSDTAADNQFLNGKIELQLGLASSTKNKTAALAWLDFFSDPVNYTTFVEKSGFSPAEPNIESSAFLKSIEPYTSTYQPAWDVVWIANNKAGEDAVYPFNYPALAPLGSSTADEAAQSAQNAWKAAF